jgi:hypothetical protein
MSLSTSEQQALESIKNGLASSDPTLVARLTMFARLASGEEMPACEKIHADSRQPARRAHRRLGLQGAALLLWLVTTVALIAVALVYSRDGGHSTCTPYWATFCADRTSASSSAPVIP